MVILYLILSTLLSLHTTKKIEGSMLCDSKPHMDRCTSALPDGYTFLKSYSIDGKDGSKKTIEYSYIFSKDTNYLIMLANNAGNPQVQGLKVTIYNSNRQPLAESFARGKYYPAISYKCNATGIYFIKFTFDNSPSYCAGSVLAFKR